MLTPYRRRVVVTIERRDDALRVLRDVGMPAEPTSDPFELVIDVGADDPATVTKVLADAGLNLRGLKSEEVSLEAVFLELTGGDGEPAP